MLKSKFASMEEVVLRAAEVDEEDEDEVVDEDLDDEDDEEADEVESETAW